VVLAGTRASAETPGFWPDNIVYKELRLIGALEVNTEAYQAALDLLGTGRYPFAELPRRCAPLSETEDLVLAMAGERGQTPPVHGVVVP
jgi:alcohol dehydrogenase